MLSEKIEGAFNKQINAELYSAYLYLSMAAYFESQSLSGMAQWMRVQAQEEIEHAMKFFDFINERGGRVTLTPIEGPKVEWRSPLDAFQDAYQHECKVTGLIHDLVELAQHEKDHAADVFLQWFVSEQVEEESSVKSIADKLEMVGDRGGTLLMLDRELGQRGAPEGHGA